MNRQLFYFSFYFVLFSELIGVFFPVGKGRRTNFDKIDAPAMVLLVYTLSFYLSQSHYSRLLQQSSNVLALN